MAHGNRDGEREIVISYAKKKLGARIRFPKTNERSDG